MVFQSYSFRSIAPIQHLLHSDVYVKRNHLLTLHLFLVLTESCETMLSVDSSKKRAQELPLCVVTFRMRTFSLTHTALCIMTDVIDKRHNNIPQNI